MGARADRGAVVTDALADLAHELRTPVAALSAIVETIGARGAELTPDQRRRFLELAITAARDIENLVASPAVSVEQVDVGALVLSVVEAAIAGGADVSAVIDGDLAVHADPGRLRQALRNLIENAVAHGPPVRVAAATRDGRVTVSVTDTGDGIAVEDQERIFERGVRLTDRPGSGIGLAVARDVAVEAGGSIDVVSAPGQGATFTLGLPPASGNG